MNMKENWEAINDPAVNCQTCNDQTKYILGLWDGVSGTHGAIFECHNLNCELKRNRVKEADHSEENRTAVVEENSRNNIQMLLIRLRRKELLITIMKMSRLLGISPAMYSNYETCRVALPVEMIERIEGVFREEQEILCSVVENGEERLERFLLNTKEWNPIYCYCKDEGVKHD